VSIRDLYEICRRTGGPIRMHLAAAATGLCLRTLERRSRDEGWWRPFPGIVAPPGTPQTAQTWARAAAAHAGAVHDPQLLRVLTRPPPLVAVTGLTAIHLLGAGSTAPSRVHLAITRDRGLRRRARLELRSGGSLTSDEVTWADGIPMASGGRIVQDLARDLDVDALRSRVINLRQRGLVNLADLRQRVTGPRFVGRGDLRAVVEELDAAGRTDSPLELLFRRRLRRHGVPLDRGQVPVTTPEGTRHLDLGIEAIRFGIEVDGFAFHATREALHNDARRANALARAEDDWRVLRVTWSDLDDFERVLAEVRETIVRQSRRHLGLDWPRPSDIRR
jgi:hypothetical protein